MKQVVWKILEIRNKNEVISGTRSGLDRVLDLVLQTGLDRVLDLVLQKGSDQVLDLGKL